MEATYAYAARGDSGGREEATYRDKAQASEKNKEGALHGFPRGASPHVQSAPARYSYRCHDPHARRPKSMGYARVVPRGSKKPRQPRASKKKTAHPSFTSTVSTSVRPLYIPGTWYIQNPTWYLLRSNSIYQCTAQIRKFVSNSTQLQLVVSTAGSSAVLNLSLIHI